MVKKYKNKTIDFNEYLHAICYNPFNNSTLVNQFDNIYTEKINRVLKKPYEQVYLR